MSKTESQTASMNLHPDRYFDSDTATRTAARAIYDEVRSLPLICPHGHVDPQILATNEPFPEPTALLITPDHYIFRMLYSQGIPMEKLGIPSVDGRATETDPRCIWQLFAENYFLFRATPTGAWLDYELSDLFGVREKLNADSGMRIYDRIAERLATSEFRPRALFDRFNIEVLTTTDKASDLLEHHAAIQESSWRGVVKPCFRPDAVFRIARPEWVNEIGALEVVHGSDITSYKDFVNALEKRREFFIRMGATSTDHAVVDPFTERLSDVQADRLFQRALSGETTVADQRRFEAHMLMESARMSSDDGMVMQLHPGSFRDHNESVSASYGSDKGGDIPVVTEYTRNLQALLNAYGNNPDFTLVVFTLDESTYSRELAPLSGHYPSLKLGPPWWFNDSIEGITRFRRSVTETAGIYNTVGFNDDTRAFCSIPARHDLARRVDANWLGGLVARHVIDLTDAREMARALAYDLVKKAYKLDSAPAKNGAVAGAPS